ncbi:putative 3'5' cyclic nucleotide phosphodiesterase [Trypanosoma vivax]|uniref:Phosphodiesterase n=1 Tax=Trypanosoma vivax (strain Y486) TaxID=1055687 RepID=G0U460_TRYVY|nr:putative phosphodiesterase [Trypanosoma vivax]KAH8611234.1 putative 3'5' cyclic nucleotide phosphodiesterase [Trypanosoma vivax]CCC52222.1 putative phosphodiesterase [Trypanosoma vivax Y486]
MLAKLRQCPSMFATTPDGLSVMAKLSDSAEELAMYVAATDGRCYHSLFGETELNEVKVQLNREAGWSQFFDIVRNAFNNSCVTTLVPSEDFIYVLCYTPDCKSVKEAVCFTVKKTNEDVLPLIVKGLVDVDHLYTHPKERERELIRLVEEVEQARIEAEQLDNEVRVLEESQLWQKEYDAVNMRRIAEYRKSLAELASNTEPQVHGDAQFKDISGLELCANQACVCRRKRSHLSFESVKCKDYDKELLRLIKSRWITTEAMRANTPPNSVIIPYTQSELQERLGKLTDPKHKIVWDALDSLDEWSYNVFDVQVAMAGNHFSSLAYQENGGSLLVTMYALLMKYQFLHKFNVDEHVALNWLCRVEDGYHCNPYHNSMHAADVVHITHYILSKGGLVERCKLSDIQVFAALFAAAIHDYGHPGVNNNFHISIQTYDAVLYNDRSVLENTHVSSVFKFMENPQYDILIGFPEEQRREIRDTVIEMVLATDMSLHTKYLNEFKCRLRERPPFTSRRDQNLALSMALKMADISNCGRSLDVYLNWSAKVSDEFFMQGDRERCLGLPCSPFMDRMNPTRAQGQSSFMNYVFLPFYETMAEFLPNMHFAVKQGEACRAYWET